MLPGTIHAQMEIYHLAGSIYLIHSLNINIYFVQFQKENL